MLLALSSRGALLEDAMASFCGHSYGGGTLQRVYDTVQSNFFLTTSIDTPYEVASCFFVDATLYCL